MASLENQAAETIGSHHSPWPTQETSVFICFTVFVKFWKVLFLLSVIYPGAQTIIIEYYKILKEINTEYSLEGLILKPKLQYFGHLMRRANSLEKTQMMGKIEGRRRRGQQRIRWLDGILTQWT